VQGSFGQLSANRFTSHRKKNGRFDHIDEMLNVARNSQ
jgi:hypothetical protein